MICISNYTNEFSKFKVPNTTKFSKKTNYLIISLYYIPIDQLHLLVIDHRGTLGTDKPRLLLHCPSAAPGKTGTPTMSSREKESAASTAQTTHSTRIVARILKKSTQSAPYRRGVYVCMGVSVWMLPSLFARATNLSASVGGLVYLPCACARTRTRSHSHTHTHTHAHACTYIYIRK